MASDPLVQELLEKLQQLDANDVAEDAAFQAQIDSLSTNLSTVTAERDTLQAQVVALQLENASREERVAALEVLATDYEKRLDALELDHVA